MPRPRSTKPSVKLRERPLADGRRSLMLEIYHNQRRRYESIGIILSNGETPAERRLDDLRRGEAEEIRAKREIDLARARQGLSTTDAPDRSTSLVEYWRRFIHRSAAHPRALRWLEIYDREQKTVTRFSDITVEWWERYARWLQHQDNPNYKTSRPLAPVTSRNYLLVTKSALRQGMLDDLLDTAVYMRLKVPKKIDPETDFLTIDELRRLARTPCRHPLVKQAFLFACYGGGLRLSDVLDLRWSQVHLGERRITRRAKKTGKILSLPLSDQAIELLPERGTARAEDRVFPVRITPTAMGRALRDWGTAAGLNKRVHFHMSRHTHAMLLLTEAGTDLATVSRQLDHSNIATTMRYLHVLDEHKRAAVDRLPRLDGEEGKRDRGD